MAWVRPTKEDLVSTLSQIEVDYFKQSPDYEMAMQGSDPVLRLLDDTAEMVRGYLRKLANEGHLKMHPTDYYIPQGLMNPAMDICAFKLLKRFGLDISEPRKTAYEQAMQILRDVAEEKMMPESYDGTGEETYDEQLELATSLTPVYMMDFNPHTLCNH